MKQSEKDKKSGVTVISAADLATYKWEIAGPDTLVLDDITIEGPNLALWSVENGVVKGRVNIFLNPLNF